MKWNHFQDILPVLTLAIGYGGTFVTEAFRDRSANRRARGLAITEFERALLLETQEALYQYAGEIQDFAYSLRGEASRSHGTVVETVWRAGARLEMLATRVESDETREVLGEVLSAGQAVSSGTWPGPDDEWSEDDWMLLDKIVDIMLECEQRAALQLGDRLRDLTYRAA
ncbi:MAG: hypothetical protein ACRDV7_14250 [Acidimicrobiia bacterium]|jgi:hypothetical protein